MTTIKSIKIYKEDKSKIVLMLCLDFREMLEQSLGELQLTVEELDKRVDGVGEESKLSEEYSIDNITLSFIIDNNCSSAVLK